MLDHRLAQITHQEYIKNSKGKGRNTNKNSSPFTLLSKLFSSKIWTKSDQVFEEAQSQFLTSHR